MLNVPILLLVFNRPDTTSIVFEEIRRAKPTRLYVACDGARDWKKGELEDVEKVRKIARNVDWDCEVKTLFRDQNLGCKLAVSGGIEWFFSNECRGIVIEDDCLPSQSFFRFCSDLLERYEKDKRVWHISGATVREQISEQDSYHFSAYPGVWGWATWRDRWMHYDVSLGSFSSNQTLTDFAPAGVARNYWKRIFKAVQDGLIDTWDYQWIFTMWLRRGLAITPNVNLISNIGFGGSATHTRNADSELAFLPRREIIQLTHPLDVTQQLKFDDWLKRKYFSDPSVGSRIFQKLRSFL